MKSISFTHFEDKLLNDSKRRTFRVSFIPTYEIGETVNIAFKKDKVKKILFEAIIKNIYPKQIKDVSLFEAMLDGFDSVEEFRKGIMEINKVGSLNRYGFFTVFKRVDKE